MSEILKEIKQWCKAIGDEQHRKKALRREKEVKHEAQLRVQVREFGGELFFCFDGIPLLHEDDLAIDRLRTTIASTPRLTSCRSTALTRTLRRLS